MVLTANIPAPDFELLDETETKRKLSDYLGKTVVLYFYPKDDTPGCTTEACTFRDDYSAYESADIVILGVNLNSPRSHAKFKNKYALPFSLLADENHAVCELYGVWGRKKMMGKEYDGVFRTTFVVDKAGIIQSVFEGVKPAGHSLQVLDAVKKIV